MRSEPAHKWRDVTIGEVPPSKLRLHPCLAHRRWRTVLKRLAVRVSRRTNA